MKNRIQFLIPTVLALWLCGCSTNFIKETWKSPACPPGPVQKVAVIAVDERGDVRAGMENRVVRELRARGQEATATVKLMRLEEIKADKEAAGARLREAGADVVLIVRLVDQATYRHEVNTTPGVLQTGVGAYDGFTWYDYYSAAFAGMGVISSSTERELYFDSTLFDLKTGKRLWSALTLTVLRQDSDPLHAADDLAAKLARAMHKDGLVR